MQNKARSKSIESFAKASSNNSAQRMRHRACIRR
jgi:hypothetical protein